MLTGAARRYLGRGQVDVDAIRAALWTPGVDARSYAEAGDGYQAAILEQYKLYVEMADRVSARRGAANTFFLTVNTAVFTAVNVVWAQGVRIPPAAFVLPVAMLVVQCGAWLWILRSYRQLASAKYRVVGMIEERLPASPYWRAEWKGLGSGRDRSLYWPLAYLEQWVPVVFAVAYLTLLGLVVAAAV
ncbi:RipA family octameric membrane protein [Micromonospora sp. URMC 103]|uniref:RipA family octameric membrane protein n=1 Tax=Micromonospora sp. URMC 103 TaxID=3423406 RepID=UPI003F1BC288